MKKIKFPLGKVYTLLGSGPTVLITSSLKGKPNIMPIAWMTPLDFDPPIVACCIGDHSFTFQIVKKTKEFAINIPTVEMVNKVYACGQVSGKEVDKFKRFRLTAIPASKIKAPLIAECYASLECKVIDLSLINKYNLFIAKVVAAWVEKGAHKTLHHITGRKFLVAEKEIKAR
jgi:flavin reductase (DIM6/NTAB) family NADH-FMN oxidoreductase RutF